MAAIYDQEAPDGVFTAALVMTVLGGILHVVAIATPWWSFIEIEFFGDFWESNYGLFNWCRKTIKFDGSEDTTCRKISEPEGMASR